MRRCGQCAAEARRVPHEPVKVVEVVSRDGNGVPVEWREYRIESEAGRAT